MDDGEVHYERSREGSASSHRCRFHSPAQRRNQPADSSQAYVRNMQLQRPSPQVVLFRMLFLFVLVILEKGRSFENQILNFVIILLLGLGHSILTLLIALEKGAEICQKLVLRTCTSAPQRKF